MDWYPHNIDAYDADTLHLTPAEDGIYSRLLRWYYKHERPLPNDEVALAAIARVGVDEWRTVAPRITALFVTRDKPDGSGTQLHKKKCDEVLIAQTKRRKDGRQRQHKLRKHNIVENVTRDKHEVSRTRNAPRGEERRTEENKDSPRKPPKGGEYTPDFLELWKAKPSRGKADNPKLPAFRAYLKALKNGAEHAVLLKALTRCREDLGEKNGTEFAPCLSTWLNERRWERDVETPAPSQAAPEPPPDLKGWRLTAWKELGAVPFASWIAKAVCSKNGPIVTLRYETRFMADHVRDHYGTRIERWMQAEDATIERLVVTSDKPFALPESYQMPEGPDFLKRSKDAA